MPSQFREEDELARMSHRRSREIAEPRCETCARNWEDPGGTTALRVGRSPL